MRDAKSILMSPGEVQAIMGNPHGLRLLMDHEDHQYSQGASMLEPGEVGPWPTARYTFLKDRGRAIMSEDLELWDDSIKREFGFKLPNTEAERQP